MDFLAPLQGGWGVIQSAGRIGSNTKRKWNWEHYKAQGVWGTKQRVGDMGGKTNHVQRGG